MSKSDVGQFFLTNSDPHRTLLSIRIKYIQWSIQSEEATICCTSIVVESITKESDVLSVHILNIFSFKSLIRVV